MKYSNPIKAIFEREYTHACRRVIKRSAKFSGDNRLPYIASPSTIYAIKGSMFFECSMRNRL